jgi:L-gulono-1,4-lactone dehydrogenase
MAQGWQNWGRTAGCAPEHVSTPTSEDALVALVRAAAGRGGRVKVVGSGHSWTDIACTDDTHVRLDQMASEPLVADDRQSVDVAACMRLADLVAFLAGEGLALPNLGSIAEQKVAGVVATGTHGTGVRTGNLSTFVLEMRLVDGTGELRTLSPTSDPEAFRDARVNLGCLGILTRLRLRVVPAFRLREQLRLLPFAHAVSALPELLDAHAHVKLWWLPGTDQVQVYSFDPTDEPDSGPGNLAVRLDQAGLARPAFAAVLGASRVMPSLVPALHRFVQAASFGERVRVQASPRVFNLGMPPVHDECEYAVPLAETQEALLAWRGLLRGARYAVDFMQEVRFVAADDIALSPAHGHAVACIGAYQANPKTAPAYFRDFQGLMARFAGRPHWGKTFHRDGEDLAPLYPRWADFVALRARMDPGGVFRNAFVDRLFPPDEA